MSYVYRAVMGGWDRMPVGAWYSTQDQFPTNADTPQAATINTTVFARDIVVVDSSKFKVSQAGIYNIEYTAQLHNTGGGGNSAHAHLYLAKNGNDITYSANRKSIIANNPYVLASRNFMVEAAVDDYFQIMLEVSHVGCGLEFELPNATPGIPSISVTINQVG
jgi:hypothetical protein